MNIIKAGGAAIKRLSNLSGESGFNKMEAKYNNLNPLEEFT